MTAQALLTELAKALSTLSVPLVIHQQIGGILTQAKKLLDEENQSPKPEFEKLEPLEK